MNNPKIYNEDGRTYTQDGSVAAQELDLIVADFYVKLLRKGLPRVEIREMMMSQLFASIIIADALFDE